MKNNELNPIILSSLYDDELYSLDQKSALKKCVTFGKHQKSCIILVKEIKYPKGSKIFDGRRVLNVDESFYSIGS